MRVYKIFNSIDGEVNCYGQGHMTTFIRFSGCNLNCSYCDTKYAQKYESGFGISISKIIKEVNKIGCKKVTLTGGEPLLQPHIVRCIGQLLENRNIITIETNGSIKPPVWHRNLAYVMDYKLESSGMGLHMQYENFIGLGVRDFVKFVIGSALDYRQAKKIMNALKRSGCRANFAMSPIHGEVEPLTLIEWLQKDKIFDIVINLQLHKYIMVE